MGRGLSQEGTKAADPALCLIPRGPRRPCRPDTAQLWLPGVAGLLLHYSCPARGLGPHLLFFSAPQLDDYQVLIVYKHMPTGS